MPCLVCCLLYFLFPLGVNSWSWITESKDSTVSGPVYAAPECLVSVALPGPGRLIPREPCVALALSCISPADELPASPQAGQPSLFGVSTSLLLPLLSFQDPAAEQTRLFLPRFMRRGTGLLPRRQCPGGVFSTPCPPAVSGGDCVPLGRARVLADVVMVSSGPSPAVLLVGRGCRQRP